MKITVIGSSGSGKSTLAKKLARKFNVPRIEIDRIWFKHGGHKLINNAQIEEKEAVSKKIENDIHTFLVKNQNWVIEGTYSSIQPVIAEQADIVILVQRPLLNRMWGHIVRVFEGRDRHPEVTKIQDLWFVKTIFRRWKNGENKKLNEFSKQYSQKLVTLKSFSEVNKYFDSLAQQEKF